VLCQRRNVFKNAQHIIIDPWASPAPGSCETKEALWKRFQVAGFDRIDDLESGSPSHQSCRVGRAEVFQRDFITDNLSGKSTQGVREYGLPCCCLNDDVCHRFFVKIGFGRFFVGGVVEARHQSPGFIGRIGIIVGWVSNRSRDQLSLIVASAWESANIGNQFPRYRSTCVESASGDLWR